MATPTIICIGMITIIAVKYRRVVGNIISHVKASDILGWCFMGALLGRRRLGHDLCEIWNLFSPFPSILGYNTQYPLDLVIVYPILRLYLY